jgi:fatty-acyl-CoA synthase
MPNALNVSSRDVVLPVVPMFHVNAWGLPYSVPLAGAKMVFPGPALDGKSLYDLFEAEGVSSRPGCRPSGSAWSTTCCRTACAFRPSGAP